MYKLTFTRDLAVVERLTKIGAYPFKYGGVEWTMGHSVIVDDLRPFLSNKRELTWNPSLSSETIIEKGLLDSRLTVEIVNEEESNGEHSKS